MTMLTFKVTAQYQKGPEQVLAQFVKNDDADRFITEKLQTDSDMRVLVTYKLYDMGELVKKYEPGSQSSESGNVDANTSAAGGQTSGASFRPNPLQTSLRPSGMPSSNFRDDNKDDTKR